MLLRQLFIVTTISAALMSCSQEPANQTPIVTPDSEQTSVSPQQPNPVRPEIYAKVDLQADLSGLSGNQRSMLSKLIDAAALMDELFWRQAYGPSQPFLDGIEDERERQFAQLNYGPWDRLADNQAFIGGVEQRPAGARFYPTDMSKAEFDAWSETGKVDLYSLVRRDSRGQLVRVPYSEAYRKPLQQAASLLKEASQLAEDADFSHYLKLRADALLSDDYRPSDLAWMSMKNNRIDTVIGPIETYEDQLFGYRASFEAYVLLKDMEWSQRLARFASFLPQLQSELPVPSAYKQQLAGSDSELNAYDVLYYAGHSNAGSKTIAINLPNDETVQQERGTRRLQLKNAMRAKFDKIMLPIAGELIDPAQRQHVTFDAFFANTMFHEVAHGLGLKTTIEGGEFVRTALKEFASGLEEGKADVLGLYMVTKLHQMGELGDVDLTDNYVTFLAGIFRSIRFGAASAHGQANMVRFNYFSEQGAFSRDPQSGYYTVDEVKMAQAIDKLSEMILRIQGDGDYQKAAETLQQYGMVKEQLAADLARLQTANIPVDIEFVQGKAVLGL